MNDYLFVIKLDIESTVEEVKQFESDVAALEHGKAEVKKTRASYITIYKLAHNSPSWIVNDRTTKIQIDQIL